MFKRRVLSLALVVSMLAGGALAVGAQDTTSELPWAGPVRTALAVAAEESGLTQTDIVTQMRQGATLREIVEEAGGDAQAVVDAALIAATELIEQAVANGQVTEEDAAVWLTHVESMIEAAMDGDRLAGQGLAVGRPNRGRGQGIGRGNANGRGNNNGLGIGNGRSGLRGLLNEDGSYGRGMFLGLCQPLIDV